MPSITRLGGHVLHARAGGGAFDEEVRLNLTETAEPARRMASYPSYFLRMFSWRRGMRRRLGDVRVTGSTGFELAHAALGTPFVVITVTATLVGFDYSLIRAAQSLGATPTTTFFRVVMPLITPGVISGALFAFITSLDEVVVVLFIAGVEQRTIPREMWSGIREHISPTILAVATILVAISVALLVTVELLRRRSARLRGLEA